MATFNNTTSNSATQRRFDFYVRVIRNVGIPIFFNKIPKLFTVYDITCNICTCMTIAAVLMDIVMNTGGLETSMETLRIAAPATMITGIYGFVRWRVNAFTRLMVLTESFSMKYVEPTEHRSDSLSMARWIPRIRMVVKILTIFSLIFIPMYTLIRTFRDTNRQLTFNAWYPYDTSVSPAFELTALTQVIGGSIYVITFHGFNGLYATMVTMVCMELEDIRTNILDIGEIARRPMEMSSSAKTNKNQEQSYNMESESVFPLRQQQLNECVRRHQYVLSYIQVMERTLNPIMAEILLLLLISMCMFSFSAVTSWENTDELVVAAVGYFQIAVSLACLCWFGSQISDQAEKVRDAAYGCDWIGAPISFQRCVAMIITITNKEVALTAGKIAPLNIKTMMNMISQSLSYFMFLLEVKDKFNEPEYVANS